MRSRQCMSKTSCTFHTGKQITGAELLVAKHSQFGRPPPSHPRPPLFPQQTCARQYFAFPACSGGAQDWAVGWGPNLMLSSCWESSSWSSRSWKGVLKLFMFSFGPLSFLAGKRKKRISKTPPKSQTIWGLSGLCALFGDFFAPKIVWTWKTCRACHRSQEKRDLKSELGIWPPKCSALAPMSSCKRNKRSRTRGTRRRNKGEGELQNSTPTGVGLRLREPAQRAPTGSREIQHFCNWGGGSEAWSLWGPSLSASLWGRFVPVWHVNLLSQKGNKQPEGSIWWLQGGPPKVSVSHQDWHFPDFPDQTCVGGLGVARAMVRPAICAHQRAPHKTSPKLCADLGEHQQPLHYPLWVSPTCAQSTTCNFNNAQAGCIVKGKPQKSLLAIFWGILIFSSAPVLWTARGPIPFWFDIKSLLFHKYHL